MIPFQVGRGDHTFVAGKGFDDVLGLYVFDRQPRLLVLDGLERAEVALRANLTDTMAGIGGPHWYLDPAWFTSAADHQRLHDLIRDECHDQLRRPAEAPGEPGGLPVCARALPDPIRPARTAAVLGDG
jgi:hypothetical protein